MTEEKAFGFNATEIQLITGLGQISLAVLAVVISVINLWILKKINVGLLLRWINERFINLNASQIVDEEMLLNDPLFSDEITIGGKSIKDAKRDNFVHFYLNILESVYLEVKHGNVKMKSVVHLFSRFLPPLVNNPEYMAILINGGFDTDFIKFCRTYISKPPMPVVKKPEIASK